MGSRERIFLNSRKNKLSLKNKFPLNNISNNNYDRFNYQQQPSIIKTIDNKNNDKFTGNRSGKGNNERIDSIKKTTKIDNGSERVILYKESDSNNVKLTIPPPVELPKLLSSKQSKTTLTKKIRSYKLRTRALDDTIDLNNNKIISPVALSSLKNLKLQQKQSKTILTRKIRSYKLRNMIVNEDPIDLNNNKMISPAALSSLKNLKLLQKQSKTILTRKIRSYKLRNKVVYEDQIDLNSNRKISPAALSSLKNRKVSPTALSSLKNVKLLQKQSKTTLTRKIRSYKLRNRGVEDCTIDLNDNNRKIPQRQPSSLKIHRKVTKQQLTSSDNKFRYEYDQRINESSNLKINQNAKRLETNPVDDVVSASERKILKDKMKQMELRLVKVIRENREKNIFMKKKSIQQLALDIAKELEIPHFKASQHWYRNFYKRYYEKYREKKVDDKKETDEISKKPLKPSTTKQQTNEEHHQEDDDDEEEEEEEEETFREFLMETFESKKFRIVMAILLLVEWMFVCGEIVCDLYTIVNNKAKRNQERWLEQKETVYLIKEIFGCCGLGIETLFLIELIAKIAVFQWKFLLMKHEVVDGIVVTITFTLSIIFMKEVYLDSYIVALALLRLWNAFRLVFGLYFNLYTNDIPTYISTMLFKIHSKKRKKYSRTAVDNDNNDGGGKQQEYPNKMNICDSCKKTIDNATNNKNQTKKISLNNEKIF